MEWAFAAVAVVALLGLIVAAAIATYRERLWLLRRRDPRDRG